MSDEQHALSIHHQFQSIDKFQWSSLYNDLHHSKFHNSSTLNLFFINWHHAIVYRINWFALEKARRCIITNNTLIPLIRNCYTFVYKLKKFSTYPLWLKLLHICCTDLAGISKLEGALNCLDTCTSGCATIFSLGILQLYINFLHFSCHTHRSCNFTA